MTAKMKNAFTTDWKVNSDGQAPTPLSLKPFIFFKARCEINGHDYGLISCHRK